MIGQPGINDAFDASCLDVPNRLRLEVERLSRAVDRIVKHSLSPANIILRFRLSVVHNISHDCLTTVAHLNVLHRNTLMSA
jgi:hypothetical protein